MISVPGGRVSEGDSLGFHGSELIETGGEGVVVGCDQVSKGGVLDESRVRDGVGQKGV